MRQYSWRHYAKKEVCSYDIRREFVGAHKQTNRASPSLSQQAPLVAKAHLMAVVRRVEQKERTKGKQLGEFVFKNLPQSRGKNLRLVVHSRQKSEAENQQYSVIRDDTERSNSESNQLVHVPQYVNNIITSSKMIVLMMMRTTWKMMIWKLIHIRQIWMMMMMMN